MYLPELKKSFIAVKLRCNLLPVFVAAAVALGLCSCAQYSHIPLAGQQSPNDATTAVKVTLQWNPVPRAASYNVYWSRFPGVTRHNSYKIADAANPIVVTDLEPDTTYYFVVTVVDDSGEGRESKEMSFAGMGATGTIDFKDLFDQAPPTAARDIVQYSGQAQATLAWDDVPDAISYNIYWRTSPGVTKLNGTKIENVKNPHTLKNLAPGKTYYLVVTAVSKDGESDISQEISYTAK